MAKIVAISGTDQPNQAALVASSLVGWAAVLGVTLWIFWGTIQKPKRRSR